MQDIQQRFGRRVRELRDCRGMTQEQLAEKAGLHPTYIGNVERGRVNSTLKNICALAAALQVDISELFRNIEAQSDTSAHLYALLATCTDDTQILLTHLAEAATQYQKTRHKLD